MHPAAKLSAHCHLFSADGSTQDLHDSKRKSFKLNFKNDLVATPNEAYIAASALDAVQIPCFVEVVAARRN